MKYLIYFDLSLFGDPKKDRLIDELNFENCVPLNRKTTSKLFVVITMKKRNFIIHPEYFDAKNIFSYQFIRNQRQKPNMVVGLSRQMKIALENRNWGTVSIVNTPIHMHHCQKW